MKNDINLMLNIMLVILGIFLILLLRRRLQPLVILPSAVDHPKFTLLYPSESVVC